MLSLPSTAIARHDGLLCTSVVTVSQLSGRVLVLPSDPTLRRVVMLLASPTYNAPALVKAMARGAMKRACDPGPSTGTGLGSYGVALPARTEVVPSRRNFWIHADSKLPRLTVKLPFASMTRLLAVCASGMRRTVETVPSSPMRRTAIEWSWVVSYAGGYWSRAYSFPDASSARSSKLPNRAVAAPPSVFPRASAEPAT